jgi:hypothetical protein
MNVRARLQRLERAAAVVGREPATVQRDVFVLIEQYDAYFRGEGPWPPDPSCPQGMAPGKWDRYLRVNRCVDERQMGALPDGEYLPDMDESERHKVDERLAALAVFDRTPGADMPG